METAADLRLIPFPKEVKPEPTSFPLNRRLVLECTESEAQLLGEQVAAEMKLAGFAPPAVRPLKTPYHVLRLSTKTRLTVKRLPLRDRPTAEEYALQVHSNAVTISANGPVGLFYGTQTLRQLIRANRRDGALPGLAIRDWPVLQWRAFQDDLTRGPSSTLANLEAQAALGSFLKMNVFTYYMEHQFAFRKHPEIGPQHGSLTAEELRALVAFARPLHIDILGNQQSFGHFTAILAHPEFAALRETEHVLCPTKEETYGLLDDLYSEEMPLLPFPYFNVCCDETDGLGEGPSKALAAKIGVGGVYAQHMRRVHELVTSKYHKRMLMWGDIILRHPEHLGEIPKDTIMLTWGYEARPSFDDQIAPFAKAGYEFLVCPGAHGWNLILPNFGVATTNIQNFVRDGAKQGALGMLNTAWDDNGETFNAPNWHAFAWGADCAWNGSTTSARDFNRRVGALLFGEPGDHFGQAIEALSEPAIAGLPSSVFWQFGFGPLKLHSAETARAQWEQALVPVRRAITHLEECRKEATANGELVDYFLYGARRIELRFQRELNRLQASVAYHNARRLPLNQALPLVDQALSSLQADRNAHEQLRHQFAELWQKENKPYALDWTLKKYRELIDKYDVEIDRLTQVRAGAKPDRSLPTPREVGLELVEDSR
jgi:hypothetical protein